MRVCSFHGLNLQFCLQQTVSADHNELFFAFHLLPEASNYVLVLAGKSDNLYLFLVFLLHLPPPQLVCYVAADEFDDTLKHRGKKTECHILINFKCEYQFYAQKKK